MNHKQSVGRDGERRVATFLQQNGYTIRTHNITLHQRGEIDIIAEKDEFLVCVEVKTRYNTSMPFECLIPRSKQRKIATVARWFVQRHKLTHKMVRFDVAFVDMTQRPVMIRYLKNAFHL